MVGKMYEKVGQRSNDFTFQIHLFGLQDVFHDFIRSNFSSKEMNSFR
jgi:hypothetical protein